MGFSGRAAAFWAGVGRRGQAAGAGLCMGFWAAFAAEDVFVGWGRAAGACVRAAWGMHGARLGMGGAEACGRAAGACAGARVFCVGRATGANHSMVCVGGPGRTGRGRASAPLGHPGARPGHARARGSFARHTILWLVWAAARPCVRRGGRP